jgi:hypothetical protein
MSSRSFRSLFMVASCAGAALSCYLVSLRVASERAALEDVEGKIVVAQRDLRVLQTEIGTRGRLPQLERWNAGAFALSAPAADQILRGSFELAQLARPERKVDFQAPVVLASAPAPNPVKPLGEPQLDVSAPPAGVSPNSLLHEASLKTETREVLARTAAVLPPATARTTDKPATAAKPAQSKSVGKPGLAAAQAAKKQAHDQRLASAQVTKKPVATSAPKKAAAPQSPVKKSVDKPIIAAARPVTKLIRLAKVDPLAPLPDKHSSNLRGSATER